MNLIRFPARPTRPKRSGAVAQSPRRRFAAGLVALAAVLAGLAFTTGTAHASGTGFCLDANAQQNYNFGGIIQWQCDDSDNYQNWTITQVADPPGVTGLDLVQFRDNGTGRCLDADAQDIREGGKIIQWQCNSTDPYQMWLPNSVDNGYAVEYASYGATAQGAPECLDANAQQTFDTGQIMQYLCDFSDHYQWWTAEPGDHDVLQNVGASS